MAEPNDYIIATRKNFVSNDNKGRMVEKCIVEIPGTFLVKIRDDTFNGNVGENAFKTHHSENDNDKVNMPLFSAPEPEVSYSNDLDFFKDFENEFPAIVYNDALTSKSDFVTEPTKNKDNDIDEIDIEQSSGDMYVVPLPNVINTDDGAYALRTLLKL
ncbi:hypothetical protein Tco_1532449 [Tanacetum coccineum]